jgi:hypothetical protein
MSRSTDPFSGNRDRAAAAPSALVAVYCPPLTALRLEAEAQRDPGESARVTAAADGGDDHGSCGHGSDD